MQGLQWKPQDGYMEPTKLTNTFSCLFYCGYNFYSDLELKTSRIRNAQMELIITLNYALDLNDTEELDKLLLLI
jgi:hypothetical protein